MLFGNIQIPKISLNIPILDGPATKGKLDVSVILQYGVGINQIGNTVILGKNLQDGTKFSDIDELSVGDYIIITDINDNVVNYKVSNVYETSDSDTSFMERDTGGKMGITLSTSNDDGSMRLIVTAEETDDVVEVPSIDNDNNNSNNNNTPSTNSNTSTGGTQNVIPITNSNSNQNSVNQNNRNNNTYQNITKTNNSSSINESKVRSNLPKTGKSEFIVICIFVAIISIIVSAVILKKYKDVK